MINIKPRPNQDRYIEILRRMTPEERLKKSWELTELTRQLLREGLRNRHPNASEAEISKMYLTRLLECHNKNY
jgi:hypothetical protein